MIPQLDFIRSTITPLLGFTNVALPDTEADDLMGCYSIAACRDDIEVVLATNDKDLYQLVGPCVKVYTTAKADLASPKDAFALLGEEEVTGKWGVPPALIGDVLAIAGDTVDNIPGVGIGRKTAAGLIREHGGLEALLINLKALKHERNCKTGVSKSCRTGKWSSSIARQNCQWQSIGSPFARITRDSSQPWKSVSLSRFYRRCGRKQPGRLPRSKGS